MVVIVHDLQGFYVKQDSGLLKELFLVRKKVESYAFSCCDKLIFLSDDIKESAKVEYLLQLMNLKIFFWGGVKEIIPDEQVSLVYSGSLGYKHAP